MVVAWVVVGKESRKFPLDRFLCSEKKHKKKKKKKKKKKNCGGKYFFFVGSAKGLPIEAFFIFHCY